MSAVNPLTDSGQPEPEPRDPVSGSHPSNPRAVPPPMRDALSTLKEEDFDFHDTIPAPPWPDDASDTVVPPAPVR